jgi:hypothetical protein
MKRQKAKAPDNNDVVLNSATIDNSAVAVHFRVPAEIFLTPPALSQK